MLEMRRSGFTLIELLVVIAIIGILSSIAIVYLSDARTKANDAKVSSNITTASTQIELDRANGMTDATALAADVTTIKGKLGVAPCTAASWNETNDAAYANIAWYSSLCSSGTFCADSSGFRGTTTKSFTGDTSGKCN